MLLPVLILFLAATLWAIGPVRARTGRKGPWRLGAVAAALTVLGIWLHPSIVVAAIVALPIAALWSFVVARRSRSSN